MTCIVEPKPLVSTLELTFYMTLKDEGAKCDYNEKIFFQVTLCHYPPPFQTKTHQNKGYN